MEKEVFNKAKNVNSMRDNLTTINLVKSLIDPNGPDSQRVVCPQCSNTRSPQGQKKKDLSITQSKKLWNCYHCGFSGSWKSELKFGLNIRLGPNGKNWFKSRGLDPDKLGMLIGSSRKAFKGAGAVCFNTFYKGTHKHTKYRSVKEKDFRVDGDVRYMFNGDVIFADQYDYVLICEGEVDACSWITAGIRSAVAVPGVVDKEGANKAEYLTPYLKALQGKRVFLLGDNDGPGRILNEDLKKVVPHAEEFGYPEWASQKFDSNDWLLEVGEEGLRTALEERLKQLPKGIATIGDQDYLHVRKVVEIGMDRGEEIDLLEPVQRFRTKRLATFTGWPNVGKSPFLDWLLYELNVQLGWKSGIYSAEISKSDWVVNMAQIYTNTDLSKGTISKDQTREFTDWLKDNIYTLETDSKKNMDMGHIKIRMKYLVEYLGIKVFVIDNWSAITGFSDGRQKEHNQIRDIMNEFKLAANELDLFLINVAHPRKPTQFLQMQGKTDIPRKAASLYEVSGSAAWNNLTDFGWIYHRELQDDNTWKGIFKVTKTKYKHEARSGEIFLTLKPSGRFVQWEMPIDFGEVPKEELKAEWQPIKLKLI